jgi:hypothetical protein
MTIDGKLDEPVWRQAEVYALRAAPDALAESGTPEPGWARFAWNAEYLFVAFEFKDSDVVAEGQADQLHHYTLGDVAEVFLKPVEQTWYWELHATPAAKQTTLFVPGRGRVGLPGNLLPRSSLRVAAHVDGTLNDWKDRDRGWTAEIAVPIAELTARGERFEPSARWTVLVARYNFSRYVSSPELSAAPRLSKTDFHTLGEYATLRLER